MLEQNEMENIVTPMMEDICDHLCRFPKEVTDQEALEGICAECQMGKYACLILNTYNREMQKWIPVTERLPEEDMYCWVTVEYPENVRCVHNGYYQLGTGFKLIASGWSNVVAWAHEDIFKPYLN